MRAFAFRAGDGPVGRAFFQDGLFGQDDGLHHLAHRAVGQQHGGHAVFKCQTEGLLRQVRHLLHGRGREDEYVEIAVTGASCCEEVIGLRRLDAAEARAAALDVDDQRGQIRARQIRDALALERDAGAGRGGHGELAGGRDAVDHVDGRDLTFRLEEHAADLRHALGHIGRDLRLRGNGVAEVMAAAAADGGFCDGLVALHQYFFLHSPLLSHFSTVMTQSGHIVAQNAQPTHWSGSVSSTGVWPF